MARAVTAAFALVVMFALVSAASADLPPECEAPIADVKFLPTFNEFVTRQCIEARGHVCGSGDYEFNGEQWYSLGDTFENVDKEICGDFGGFGSGMFGSGPAP